jgi:hypothetical protein
MLCNQPDTELFVMSYQSSPGSSTIKDPQNPSIVDDSDLSSVPSEYHEFADLFSKTESERLPPHRPHDHAIPLDPGTMPTFGPIYSMSLKELEALKDDCKANLRKGYIRYSYSPCGAPVLFIKKADGTVQLCVDY